MRSKFFFSALTSKHIITDADSTRQLGLHAYIHTYICIYLCTYINLHMRERASESESEREFSSQVHTLVTIKKIELACVVGFKVEEAKGKAISEYALLLLEGILWQFEDLRSGIRDSKANLRERSPESHIRTHARAHTQRERERERERDV